MEERTQKLFESLNESELLLIDVTRNILSVCTQIITKFVGDAYKAGSPQVSSPEDGWGDITRYSFTPEETDRLSVFNAQGMVDLRPLGFDVYRNNDPNFDASDVYLWYGEDASCVDISMIKLDELVELTKAICGE